MNALSAMISSVTAITAAGAAAVDHGMYRRAEEWLGRPVYQGAGQRRSVALTFDDGPSSRTLELLDYLEAEGVRATFFQCGINVLRHPEIARRVASQGHEIGNHTLTHTRMQTGLRRHVKLQAPYRIYRELALTQQILSESCGYTPISFRPPYGLRSLRMDAAQRRLGLACVMWTVMGHDWEWPAQRIAEHVLSQARPGAIVCLHDGRDIQQRVDLTELLGSLRSIVPALKEQGYAFETVRQIMQPDAERSEAMAAGKPARQTG